ncbi:DNA cytosine methyltransferase [Paenibacillus sp. 1A_MP2]|uniref:DNA cytosine methyltransferase n=1 Tax=Paenibacillus sp. 1A_MP2 TaxID=3457495 RepID=UPI003FCE0D94
MNNRKLTLKKVYTVSKKNNAPRLWLQHMVCEAAGLIPRSELFVQVDEMNKQITIRNSPFDETQDVYEISVSSRMNRTSGKPRPLVDTSGSKFSSILCIQEKIEISVYRNGPHAEIVVRPLRFRLFDTETFESSDERISLLTVCSGSGIGASMFVDSQYYTAVQEVEIEEDCAEVIKENFPYSYLFNGDLRDCNTVAKADVAFISLDCSEHSSIGDGGQGYFDNIVLGTYKILKAADPRVIFSENVPAFYQSTVFHNLQELLTPDYPYMIGPITIDSYNFGSIAHRKRSYTLFVKDKEDFDLFREPKAPVFRRHKLKEYLDTATDHEWKSVKTWWDSFLGKKAKNNSWADRNTDKTFVKPEECTELQCIPARYRSHSASNSYVLNEQGDQWRFLTINELRRIFQIPAWFKFPEHIPMSRIYEMIGQSVCGRVIRAFANEISSLFFRRFAGVNHKNNDNIGVIRDQHGQIGFAF